MTEDVRPCRSFDLRKGRRDHFGYYFQRRVGTRRPTRNHYTHWY